MCLSSVGAQGDFLILGHLKFTYIVTYNVKMYKSVFIFFVLTITPSILGVLTQFLRGLSESSGT